MLASTPSESPPLEKPPHSSMVSLAPPTKPGAIQQREKVVQEIYASLTRPDTTTVVLTGIGGVGKSTLAALVYEYAEKQRLAGGGIFHAQALWLRVDSTVTLADLAGTLFEAFGKPLSNLSNFTPHNLAVLLFSTLKLTEQPRLVVLDQFENLLDQQTGRALSDRPGIGEWLDALNSQSCPCRILLTSRLWPQGTRHYPPSYMQEYPVPGLEMSEGIELLRSQEVKGTEAELRTAVERCQGHAYALTLLASLLQKRKLGLTTFLRIKRMPGTG